MKRKIFDWIAAVVTLLISITGAVALYFWADGMLHNDATRHWWMGLFFSVIFLLGFAGLHIYLLLSKYKVQRPRFWYLWALIAVLLIFALGVGMEYVYMRSVEEETTTTEATKEDVDVVLLLDCSGSMDAYGYRPLRDEAAENFVNGLDGSCQLQVMCFAGGLNEIKYTDLLKMDDSGKATVTDFINSDNTDCDGTTDFDIALENALNTLQTNPNVRDDSEKAVILLTDGEVPFLVGSYFQDYLDEEIHLYTIRIYASDDVGSETQRLIDLAKDTGGGDTLLKPDDDGNIDSSAILKAFKAAYESSAESTTTVKTEFTENLLICTDSVTFWKVALRTAVLLAIAVLFGLGYFGRFSLLQVLISCAVGLVISLMAALIDSMLICMILSAALLGTAIVMIELVEGGELDV